MHRASCIAHHLIIPKRCLLQHQAINITRLLSTTSLQPYPEQASLTRRKARHQQHYWLSGQAINESYRDLNMDYLAPGDPTKEDGGPAGESLLSWDFALREEDQYHIQTPSLPHCPPHKAGISSIIKVPQSHIEEYKSGRTKTNANIVRSPLVNFIQAVNSRSAAQAWIALQEVAAYHPLGLSAVHARWLHKFNALLVSSNLQFYPRHQTTDSPEAQLPVKSRAALAPLRTSIQELRRRHPASVRAWEWNALIRQTASGHRHVSLADYYAASEVLEQWLADIQKHQERKLVDGDRDNPNRPNYVAGRPGKTPNSDPHSTHPPLPDIITYNTLLNIAAHTYSPIAFQDALQRFKAARQGRHLDSRYVLGHSLQPDRRTYLTALVYYSKQVSRSPDDVPQDIAMDLSGVDDELTFASSSRDVVYRVPELLSYMLKRDLDIGIDGINAALWVFAKAGKPDVVYNVYQALRTHDELHQTSPRIEGLHKARSTRSSVTIQKPENPRLGLLTEGRKSHSPSRLPKPHPDGLWPTREPHVEELIYEDSKRNPILDLPGMGEVIASLKPDGVTYAMVIQCLAYHGQLLPALQVFRDLLITIRETSADSSRERSSSSEMLLLEDGELIKSSRSTISLEAQTLVAYRAIFLGFIHHGAGSPSNVQFGSAETIQAAMAQRDSEQTSPSPWTLDSLLSIFHSYISLPFTDLPSARFIRTMLIAFQRTAQRGGTTNQDKGQHDKTTPQQLNVAPDYQMMMEYIYNRLVRDRFEKSREWEDAKDSREWVKLRSDFLGCAETGCL